MLDSDEEVPNDVYYSFFSIQVLVFQYLYAIWYDNFSLLASVRL